MRIFRLLRKSECVWRSVCHLFRQISLGAQKDRGETDRLSRPKTCRWIRVLSAGQELRKAITTTKSPTSELRRVTRTLRTAENTAGEALREVPEAKATRLSQKHLVKIQDGIHAAGSSLATSTPPIQPVLFYSVSVRIRNPSCCAAHAGLGLTRHTIYMTW